MSGSAFNLKRFQGSQEPLFDDAIRIRVEVYVDEQEADPETEPDNFDTEQCMHWLVYTEALSQPIATGRMFPDPQNASIGHIGRMAVLKPYRGLGIGHLILKDMLKLAPESGYQELLLEAQVYAAAFYQKLGFMTEGNEFPLENIPHILMRKRI